MKRRNKYQPPGYAEHSLPGGTATPLGPRPVCAGCGKVHAKSRRPYLYAGHSKPGETDVEAATRIVAARRLAVPLEDAPPVALVIAQDGTEPGTRWVSAWGSVRWVFDYGHFHSLRCAHAYAERMLAKYGRHEP